MVERLPRPLTRDEALMDLRHYVYQLEEWPDHQDLAIRWDWFTRGGKPSLKRVRLLKKSEDWKDDFQERAGRGQVEGSQGAGP